jgi:signal transduction histidine kinase/ActR/RegA family two-component response regulator
MGWRRSSVSQVDVAINLDQHSFALDTRLRSEQVAALYQNVTLGVVAATISAVVLAGALIQLDSLDWSVGVTWTCYIMACAVCHVVLRFRYLRARHHDLRWKFWGTWFAAISLAEGLGWGWASAFLVGNSDRFSLQMMVMVVTLNVASGAIPAFSSYLPAFFSLFLPTTIPSVIWGIEARAAFPEATMMVLLMLVFIGAMGALGVRANRGFNELVTLRIKTSELAKDLQKQKELAEQASLAKSHFLAAASHDLRQPVHALGLFAGALRAVPGLPHEATQLVERIETSTAAMDGLFSAILDISRLDAGVVEVCPQSFALQPLLERICNDHAGEASEKSVAIVLQRTSATVFTDPHLIERILRNLISNAVRYTERGRVLVGCRRRGDVIWVEVWDTGAGIPEAERERIFEEYVQLKNPERDRARGLGLGLAIVRRLGALLSCQLELRSQPGRGSCFRIAIPLAKVLPLAPPAAFDLVAAKTGLGLILVIDDEAPIRDGMRSLLTGWGYQVITAGSGSQMLANLAPIAKRPDLIICDYRLRDGENGTDVIAALQAECNEAIPAMLITGDTAEDRLIEAQASGYLLLHKPVPNGKLRASIVNLMAASERASAANGRG